MADTQAPQDPFEMFRRLWGPQGLPVPGLAMPTLDPAELDKRIADLKSIEGWLTMNLNMLKLSIQGLEMQKLALNAVQASLAAGAAAGQPNDQSGLAAGPGAAADGMLWPWSLMQQMMSAQPGARGAPPDEAIRRETAPAKGRKGTDGGSR